MLTNGTLHRFKLSTMRYISTSPRSEFKFKLTDELVKKCEEEQKRKKKEIETSKPQKALFTLNSPLIMGKVSSERYKKVIRVGIPKHRLNEHLLMYFRDLDNVYAYDCKDECDAGDWVLLKKDSEFEDEQVTHKIDRIVYKHGNYIDPITGRRSLGLYYDDDIEELEKIKIDI